MKTGRHIQSPLHQIFLTIFLCFCRDNVPRRWSAKVAADGEHYRNLDHAVYDDHRQALQHAGHHRPQ